MAKYSKVVLMKNDTLKITGYTNIQAAINDAVSGNTILVYPSTYDEQVTLKNGVDIFCYPGVIITSNSPDATVTDGGVQCICKFIGNYTIYNTGGGVEFLFSNINTVVTRTVYSTHSAENLTLATSNHSFVGGNGSSTLSPYSAVFGVGNFIGTGSDGSVVVGLNNMITSGNYSFVQGRNNLIANQYADPTVTNHVEGISNTAFGNGGHAEGIANTTVGWCSHAEGDTNITYGAMSHAEGGFGTTIGFRCHSEGRGTTAYGWYAHSEGIYTVGLGYGAHAEGRNTMAGPDATYMCSHAEGYVTTTYGQYSHSEGQGTSAIGIASHAEGSYAKAIGNQSHAEGYYTTAVGNYSHAEGDTTTSVGNYSHVEGRQTISVGIYSRTAGGYSVSQNSYEQAYSVTSNGQYSKYGLTTTTSNATGTIMYITGTEEIIIPSGSTAMYKIDLVGRSSYASNKSASYKLEGVAYISSSFASSQLLVNNKTVVYETDATWDANVGINTSDGRLRVTVTGSASTNVRWYANVEITRVIYDA